MRGLRKRLEIDLWAPMGKTACRVYGL